MWQHQAMAALVAPLQVSSLGTSPVTEGVKGSQAQDVLMQTWCIVYGQSLPGPYLECDFPACRAPDRQRLSPRHCCSRT